MTTALAAPETEVKSVVFFSKTQNLVLTRRSERTIVDGTGNKRVVTFEDWLESEREVNRTRLAQGLEPNPLDETPWKVQFQRNAAGLGEFSTTDEGLIDFLRTHPKANSTGSSGFYELGANEPQPTTAEQMREIRLGSLHRNEIRLEVALQVEQETHRRPDVLQAAEAALTDLRELLSADAPDADLNSEAPPSTQPS